MCFSVLSWQKVMSVSIEDDFYFHFDKNIGSNAPKRAHLSPMTLYKNSKNTKIRLPVLRPDFGEDEMAFKP